MKKTTWILIAIIVLYFALRLPGFSFSYHQDEVDWATVVNPVYETEYIIPHPPLGEFLYHVTGVVAGYSNLRALPLLFGAFNLVLIFWYVRRRWNAEAALWSTFIFAIGGYSAIASLMIDTDGQILPFFLLLALLAYDYLLSAKNLQSRLWFGLWLAVACFLGLMVKLSFALVPAALVLHYVWTKRHSITKRQISFLAGGIAGAVFVAVVALLVARTIFPWFNLQRSIVYWEHFIVFSGRNYLQIVIETLKGLILTSPLLVGLPFFLDKEDRKKAGELFSFLLCSVLFYLVIFDFSGAALDRYWQLLIVPLSIMSGVVIAKLIKKHGWSFGGQVVGVVAVFTLFVLQFIQPVVPALYPKSEWFARVVQLRWNFLFPFTGGSGPVGFYISFLVVACAWIFIAVCIVIGKIKPRALGILVPVILFVGIFYNGMFVTEYIFGAVNGNVHTVLKPALQFIKENPAIHNVITYNDIGSYELREMEKYQRRIYVDPRFMATYVGLLENFKQYYLYVDIPHVERNSYYGEQLHACPAIFTARSGTIVASVRDCSKR